MTTAAAPVVFETMGTVASVSGPGLPPATAARLEAICAAYDARFSLYRDRSELSRVNAHQLALTRASGQLRAVYALAEDWREATAGAFTPHRPDGMLDLSGVVKALAIRDCGAALTELGCRDWCVNVGGDILTAGAPTPGGSGWVAGIVDPADRARLLSQVRTSAALPAVCTSGTAERGDHVWRLTTAPRLRQVTVAGPDIVTADVLATALLAAGPDALHDWGPRYGIEALAVTDTGALIATPAFRAEAHR